MKCCSFISGRSLIAFMCCEGEEELEVNMQVKFQLRWWQFPFLSVLLPFQSHLSLFHDKLLAVIAQTRLSGTAGKAGRQSKAKDENWGKPGGQG